MNADLIRSHLSDLAEEVTLVDLRDRSLAASGRIAVRRNVVVATAAVSAVALVGVAAIAFRPAGQDTLPPADATTSIASPAPTIASPAPTIASPAPTSTSPSDAKPRITGTLYYYTRTGTRYRVYALTGGRATELYSFTAAKDDPCVENSLLVSPDGRYLGWVLSTTGDARGTLTLARTDGTHQHKVADVHCSFDETAWIANPTRLLVRAGTLAVDPETGNSAPVSGERMVWSANRAYRALRHGSKNSPLVVETASGTVVHRRMYTPEGDHRLVCGYKVAGLSDDGRYVNIGFCNSDPGRMMYGRFVYDMVTGRHVRLPGPYPTVLGFPGGNVLVQVSNELVLLDPSGRVLARMPEPPEVAGKNIIGYQQ